ncbi:MAG TPA: class I SAM-dependent methyltransferase [Allocoleopsis sp.]
MNNNNYIETEQKLAISYDNIGNTFYYQGNGQEAINNFNQALNLSQYLPENELGMLNFNLGRALLNIGELLSAITYFEQAIKLIPDLIQAEYHKNTILKGYNFGRDWFSRNIQIWSKYLTKFIDKPELNVLEIGSWEGRSTCWLLDNILTHPTTKITCIDTFAGSFEHQDSGENYLQSIEKKFDFNISITGKNNQVNKIVGEYWEKLRSLPLNNYDFIYIDG